MSSSPTLFDVVVSHPHVADANTYILLSTSHSSSAEATPDTPRPGAAALAFESSDDAFVLGVLLGHTLAKRLGIGRTLAFLHAMMAGALTGAQDPDSPEDSDSSSRDDTSSPA